MKLLALKIYSILDHQGAGSEELIVLSCTKDEWMLHHRVYSSRLNRLKYLYIATYKYMWIGRHSNDADTNEMN